MTSDGGLAVHHDPVVDGRRADQRAGRGRAPGLRPAARRGPRGLRRAHRQHRDQEPARRAGLRSRRPGGPRGGRAGGGHRPGVERGDLVVLAGHPRGGPPRPTRPGHRAAPGLVVRPAGGVAAAIARGCTRPPSPHRPGGRSRWSTRPTVPGCPSPPGRSTTGPTLEAGGRPGVDTVITDDVGLALGALGGPDCDPLRPRIRAVGAGGRGPSGPLVRRRRRPPGPPGS